MVRPMPRIVATAAVRPTEDPEKVRRALLNLFPDAQIEEWEDRMVSSTGNGEALRELIIDHHIRDTARAVMLRGKSVGTTRFTLNKQVAYIGKVSFLEGPVTLGGIEVVIEEDDIEGLIDYLAESTVEVPE
jgi:predicted RNA binding protein with dsRBD fold (UPF0201 family)